VYEQDLDQQKKLDIFSFHGRILKRAIALIHVFYPAHNQVTA
jgi:hypothetical protein